MVMMKKPSPIQVGREFVRQYYTLLNKAPALLHRFYSLDSSYIHGGKYCEGEPEPPVIGQTDIHKKITSLNFRDCHTKIRQVDAHTTIGSGVVVQVTGELSNAGQPLRRFMQTFVLSPQNGAANEGDNPFKFYVHNDIFRYQDEVFSDAVENSDEEEVGTVTENGQVTNDVNDTAVYDDGTYYQDQEAVPQPVLTNGVAEACEEEAPMDQHNDSPSLDFENHAEQVSPPVSPAVPEVEVQPVEETKEEVVTEQQKEVVVKEDDAPESKAEQKAFSWAVMASKNTQNARSAPAPAPVKINRPAVEKSEAPPQEVNDTARPPRPPKNQRSFPRDEERGGPDRVDAARRGFNASGPGSTNIRYPDNQQIFVGNLPYEISEDDLREHFTDFGSVLEVRINQSNSNNPNFGFVIFEDPKSVQSVLEVMPTHHKSGHRINIEEKKQKNRDGPRRPGDMRRGGGMGEGMRGSRRGPPTMRKDRQGSRDGPRPNYSNGPRR